MNLIRTSASQRRPFILACCLGALIPLFSGAGYADTVVIPLGQQGQAFAPHHQRVGGLGLRRATLAPLRLRGELAVLRDLCAPQRPL